ncbi:MAG: hypothetical protein QME55_05160, partial [Brevundimonas sp.]|uniref:hypothetical protein n=1 Tax=Brevundimonas sp. TaxID=1871086 RepID=UPI002625A6CA
MIQSLAALMAVLALGGAQDPVQDPPSPAVQLEDVEVIARARAERAREFVGEVARRATALVVGDP